MADASEAQLIPSPANGVSGPTFGSTDHERTYVTPSDYLRPRTQSHPMTPARVERRVDRDEREALKSIREFLKVRTCYDVLPLSFRLINLDTSLTVKESLSILVQNGIVSAPLWDSKTSTFAGLLTVTDYLNLVQYYNMHTDKLKDVDKMLLSDLRGVEKFLNVPPPETVSASPGGQLYDALRKMLISRARRIPLISYDDQTQRPTVTSVITQYRILKFIALNIGGTERLRKPLRMIKLGTYSNLCRCSMETPVLEVIHEMVTRGISSVPVVTTEDVLLNLFEAVDVIEILKTGDYGNLTCLVGQALTQRPDHFPGIYTCSMEDGLDTIFDTIRKSRVHRLMVVDDENKLKGILSLSDILNYILIEGQEDPPSQVLEESSPA